MLLTGALVGMINTEGEFDKEDDCEGGLDLTLFLDSTLMDLLLLPFFPPPEHGQIERMEMQGVRFSTQSNDSSQ